ncbi:MAG: metalloregulator ArsR/SmtB family transcription factor [Anaerolineales bacterium]|jgi:ArsR family transcriptional regulator|nr:metalloregulator ArsR/SmtB family transcription factor [Anaerolineales bacterium]HJO33452.1 metalloregulator ArsR/SmtB family transcription factor [Anaerolineales bacterium]|tara:strand:- start:2871 stop:3248 length:378 start_codon:yes stop_codon:yes gene_type:complete
MITLMVSGQSSDRCVIPAIDAGKVRRAQKDLLDGLTATRLSAVFKALSDPTRLRIVSLLAHHELCVCDVAAALGMTQSAVSHQLRLMREMRLVRKRPDGRMMYYSLDDEHVHDLYDRGLLHVEHE